MGDPEIDPHQWPPYMLTATIHGVDLLLSATAHGVDSILSTPWRYTLHLNHVNPMGVNPMGLFPVPWRRQSHGCYSVCQPHWGRTLW